jgi:CubicO group peptidase (beta-lactamase class C family)
MDHTAALYGSFARCCAVCALLATALLCTTAAAAQQGPPPAVRAAVDAVVKMVASTGEAPLRDFADQRLAASYRDGFTQEELLRHLEEVRDAVQGSTDGIAVELTDDGLLLQFEGARRVDVLLRLDEDSGVIHGLELVGDRPADDVGGGPLEVALRGHVAAIEGLASAGTTDEQFAVDHLTAAFRASLGAAELATLLESIRGVVSGAMAIEMNARDDEYRLEFRGPDNADVVFALAEAPPYAIRALRLDRDNLPDVASRLGPLRWESLAEQLRGAEREGFGGSVVAIRDGEVVLDDTYGLADPAAGRANSSETVFDIGSLPFDFTRAAVYLLAQRGELALDDPITRWFPAAPADKQTMTVRHLLTHRSGLPNFHHRPGDADHDLTWIDRAEAEARILAQPLRFAPGEQAQVSHSAFGFLAAIVERASGRAYEEFLRTEFFAPAGMERTGMYGDDLDLGAGTFAVGAGMQASDPNIPPQWGPTSWLVMGSGGMVSTAADLRRWFEFTRSGGVLQGESLEMFLARPFVVGGSERGFEALIAWDLADSAVFMTSNTGGPGSVTGDLVRALLRLVRAPGAEEVSLQQ